MTTTVPGTLPVALRSLLFAPGNHPRKLEKVIAAGADGVILDLEDAVAVTDKVAARALVASVLQRPRPCRAWVRINGTDTTWALDDLRSVAGPGLDGLMIPKAERADQIRPIAAELAAAEARHGQPAGAIELIPLIETARGVENCAEVAGADPRVGRLAFGGGDYTRDLDLVWTPDEDALAYARARLTHVSRVADLAPPVDTVVLQVRDLDRFRQSALNGRRFGFGGKLCLHPDQVATCNAVFSPDPEEIARAKAVIDAFEAAEASGNASLELAGEFIDYAIVARARRVLALAAATGVGTTQ
jgi:citrate lyase subunit beta / citryl-CoA lyase